MIGHWGKTFLVSRGNSPQKKQYKMCFADFLSRSAPIRELDRFIYLSELEN